MSSGRRCWWRDMEAERLAESPCSALSARHGRSRRSPTSSRPHPDRRARARVGDVSNEQAQCRRHTPSESCPRLGRGDCIGKTGDTRPAIESARSDRSSNWQAAKNGSAVGEDRIAAAYAAWSTVLQSISFAWANRARLVNTRFKLPRTGMGSLFIFAFMTRYSAYAEAGPAGDWSKHRT